MLVDEKMHRSFDYAQDDKLRHFLTIRTAEGGCATRVWADLNNVEDGRVLRRGMPRLYEDTRRSASEVERLQCKITIKGEADLRAEPADRRPHDSRRENAV